MRRVLRSSLLLAVGFVLAAACGGRTLTASPGDDDVGPAVGGAGGAGGAAGGFGGAGGLAVGGRGGTGGDGSGGFNPIECFGCITASCPQAIACVTDPACVQGMICAVGQCLGEGEPDLLCVADCFDGDLEAALTAIQAITCVFGDCGDVCGGLFPFP